MSKKILVTGGGGFIGHHFVQYVLEMTDWQVVVLYRNNTKRIQKSDRVECIKIDLTQKIDLDIEKIDYVVHMASETYVDDSLKNCISFVRSNVLGTANLLEWIKKNHWKAKVCVFSSDEVMGPAPEGIYFKENDLRKPSNPYAATKAGAELLAYSFAHSFNMSIFVIRCMNVLGEGESFKKFIPKTFKSIKEGEKIVLHGTSLENVTSRHWIYAKDVADAVLFLLKEACPKEIYHIAGEERDVYSLAKMIYFSIKGQEMPIDAVKFVDFHTARPGHDRRYSLSNKKLLKMGWKSKWGLDKCIENIVKDLEKKYSKKENLS
jgi:dTDP-glucose 4,6-dehydratase